MNDDAADHRLIMDWLLVWVDGAGCGRHTSADPTRFIHRLAEVSYHVFDVICAERITDPVWSSSWRRCTATSPKP